jgi:hemolysin activation/secretion protein
VRYAVNTFAGVACVVAIAAAPPAHSQLLPRPGTPSERSPLERLPEPQLPRPPAPPVLELPQVAPPADAGRLSSALRVRVKAFRVTGNTVFPDDELLALLAPYVGREIGNEELEEARLLVTTHYVGKGYINSGAVIPDQDVRDGVIELRVIEGRLAEIAITGDDRFHPDYIRGRVAARPDEPLNVGPLQERLQLLLQNPLVERVNAELAPGERLGEAALRLDVKAVPPYEAGYTLANNRSPSIGSYFNEFRGSARNLFGRGAGLHLRYGATPHGLEEYSAALAVPVTPRDTVAVLRAEKNRSVVIEEPFSVLDIASRSSTVEAGVSHPFYRTLQREFALGAYYSRRENRTYLLGQPFSFTPGLPEGQSTVKALRIAADWFDRGETQVMAARLSVKRGLDISGATINPGFPDGSFIASFLQLQWVRRVSELGDQLVYRLDAQVANGPLLPSEKFALGGQDSIRGYRENRLVADQGWFSSVEYRRPVGRWIPETLSDRQEDGRIQLAAFLDAGRGRDEESALPSPELLWSVGAGARWEILPGAFARLYYGKAMRKVFVPDPDPQDRGWHFLISISKTF